MPSKWAKNLLAKRNEEYRERLKNARPSVDTNKPREMPMSQRKELERRRVQLAIERDNRLMLDRLGKAMSKKNIDNERKHLGFPSLKEAHKRLELQRIVEENQRLLTRIQNTAPVYNHLQWEQEAEHRVDILRNMTEFPDYFKPPGNSNLMIMKKKAQDFTEKQMEKSSRSPTRSSSRGGTGLGGSGSGYEYRPRTGESHNSENFGKPPSPAQRAGREVIRPVSSSNITHYEHHQQQQLGDYENNY